MKPPKSISADDTLNILLGLCVGDALGVPVEFNSRESLRRSPVTDMVGWGTHNQRSGTWSDDSSLAFCLADSLCRGYNLDDIAQSFVGWYRNKLWTPHGSVFDVGIATSNALHRVEKGVSPVLSGGTTEYDNGNGSLMRILPLIIYLNNRPVQERYRIVSEVSGITHAHIRSVFACFYYCEFALLLLSGLDKFEAFAAVQATVNQFLNDSPLLDDTERNRFHRVLENHAGINGFKSLWQYADAEIASSGYVIHTLEASIWCLLTTDTYADAVLKAVNLGDDTDTTGCVTGGLAGLYYGWKTIPQTWLNLIARKDDIIKLSQRLYRYYA